MKTSMLLKISTSLLLFAEALSVTIPVIILGNYFNFPDILREPASKAFELFKMNQNEIQAGYYIFLISSLLYIPLSYQLSQWFKSERKILSQALQGLGIATTVFQSIGFIRWIFTMPFLTEMYFGNTSSKETAALLYETLNRYAGMSIGEHLGFIAMGSWTIILAALIIKQNTIKKWLGYAGLFIGILLLFSVIEHFGGKQAPIFGALNFIANSLWTFWIVAIAINILLIKPTLKN
ncbi:hypothetical protein CHU92_00450 [Flavobacterium cyanobacteriorum]|uniref:DUF4386 domain-containing protein n=1 Tax=Flavobacterium cyanobacteriorum TaxID=2022802 RepID=A0A256A5Y3_9FLAO|nr:DUF4386 domain-containing protein [Flavobacterium cyanobacteriorum]OYQ49178.1 hypothetical protein CHU92_00450 [Flavobacterium cyanobacteriorum]